ncbi:hypothetical protein Afe04nite_76850 [Asanoa ferruginea]|nr:hypothetical protein Afe04nite_76850 [Asanoa ferruginea]
MEDLLVTEADVDGDRVPALPGHPDQTTSELPGIVMVKAVEPESFFLLLKLWRHGWPSLSWIVSTI